MGRFVVTTKLQIVVAMLALCVAGCSSDSGVPRSVGGPAVVAEIDGSIELRGTDQESNGEAVIVQKVVLADSGYVAIYEERNGAPGQILGVSPLLDSGEHLDVLINLDEALTEPTGVFAMLHDERNGNAQLDFPGSDEPIEEDGRIITVLVQVSIT